MAPLTGATCLYTILGLERSATELEIKKAYRRLALKWHPDKNSEGNKANAERKFKEISAAYEILSDPEKRRSYDQYGFAGLRTGAEGPPRSSSPPNRGPTDGARCRYPRSASSAFRRHTTNTGFPTASFFDHDDFFFNFAFRDPEEIFREFFAEHILFMNSFMEPFTGSAPTTRVTHAVRRANTLGPDRSGSTSGTLFSTFMATPGSGAATFLSSSPNIAGKLQQDGGVKKKVGVSVVPPHGGTFRSTSTKFLGGKCVTTRKVVQDGVETVTVEENGVVKSKTVNGKRVTLMSV